MKNVLVREVPEKVHEALQKRARAQGKSLQQYLLAELERIAERPTMDDWLAQVSAREGGRIGFETAAGELESERRLR